MQSKKIYKVVFSAKVQTVSLALKFPCVVSVTWRRGQKTSEVKQRREIEKGVVTFNQTLQLQCNMEFDTKTNTFGQKKTKFTVLIFSQKGNKQAGEVHLDVAQLLNEKKKSMKYQIILQKCPDKNAKLNFVLQGYVKQQIQLDAVSHRSIGTTNNQFAPVSNSSIQIPDFKKKKDEPVAPLVEMKRQQKEPEPPKQARLPVVNKISKERLKLQEEYKSLKIQYEEFKELEAENTKLKRIYEQAQKKSQSYYNKKLQQLKKQFNEAKKKSKQLQQKQKEKQTYELQICSYKQKMGRILNFAMDSQDNQLAQQISNIYMSAR